MHKTALACEGFYIGTLRIPPFTLKYGEYKCVHWPIYHGSIEEKQWWDYIYGHFFVKFDWSYDHVISKSLTVTELPVNVISTGHVHDTCKQHRQYFVGSFERIPFPWNFRRKTLRDYLKYFLPLPHTEIDGILNRLAIGGEWKLAETGLTQRLLLAIERGWHRSNLLFYEDTGLDPLGRDKVKQSIISNLGSTRAAMLFSCPLARHSTEVTEIRGHSRGDHCILVTCENE